MTTATTLTATGHLLDALFTACPNGFALEYVPVLEAQVCYLHTDTDGIALVLAVDPARDPEAPGAYAVAYAPLPRMSAAVDWLGTHTDTEAGTTYHADAVAAVAAFVARYRANTARRVA